MAETKKSLIEQAVADFDLMRESLKTNTEDIFRAVAKDEIKSSLKENINEADYDEEDVDDELENDVDVPENDDTKSNDEVEGEPLDNNSELEPTMEPEDSEDYTGSDDSDDYTIDMTGSDDEEVISVFKKMGNNDGVEVVSDDEVKITTPDGGEYQIKMNGKSPMDDDTEVSDLDFAADADNSGEESEDEGIMFEIEMDEDDEVIEEDIVRGKGHDKYAGSGSLPTGNIEGQKAQTDSESGDNLEGGFDDDAVKHANAEGPMVMKEDEESDDMTENYSEEEETIEEQIPVGMAQDKRVPATNAKEAGIVGAGADLATKLAETEAKYKKLLAEAKKLEAENNEFKDAVLKLRKGLGETGLYTRNLSSATKLFLEHSTTKEEKYEIMKRFDNVKTIKESKELEKIISSELTNRKSLTESFDKRINSSTTSSHSKSLQESSTYVDPSIKRALELMKKQ